MEDCSRYVSSNVFNSGEYRGQCTTNVTDLENLLFTSDRFDLVAKLLYAERYYSGEMTNWHSYVYTNHIGALNNFIERDGGGKKGAHGFRSAFDDLLNAEAPARPSTLNVIPVNQAGAILDGAHRLVRAYLRREPVHLVHMRSDIHHAYDYRFFERRGMNPDVADAIASHFCTACKSSQCFVFFPNVAHERELIEKLMRRYFDVFYCRPIKWTGRARHNIVASLYEGEPWLGSFDDGFRGSRGKYKHCFTARAPLLFYVARPRPGVEINTAKAEIRQSLKFGQHSLHASTNPLEKARMAQLFLNRNTVHWFNTAAAKYPAGFLHFLKAAGSSGAKNPDCCLSGSSVYAAYGIRDVRDLDCVHAESLEKIDSRCQSHNEYLRPFYERRGKRVTDMIYDPRLHFYYFGHKIISIYEYNKLKRERMQRKDVKDLRRWYAFLTLAGTSRLLYSVARAVRGISKDDGRRSVSEVRKAS